MGYGADMIRELEETLNRVEADVVLVGTPIDLTRFLHVNRPVQRARYEVQEVGEPLLTRLLTARFRR